jgi:hypothetical protein
MNKIKSNIGLEMLCTVLAKAPICSTLIPRCLASILADMAMAVLFLFWGNAY